MSLSHSTVPPDGSSSRSTSGLPTSAASRDLLEHNTFTPPNTPPGGAPSIAYGGGCWDLGPDEVLVIEHDEPDAHYWNWSVHHLHWFDSGAWHERSTSTNGCQAHVDADGRVRVVVAATDPGVPNWLDTEGRPLGMAVYRYVGARTTPHPDGHRGRIGRPAHRRAGRSSHRHRRAAARSAGRRGHGPRSDAGAEGHGLAAATDTRVGGPAQRTRRVGRRAGASDRPRSRWPAGCGAFEHGSRRLRGRHVASALRRPGAVAAGRGAPDHGGPAGRADRTVAGAPPAPAAHRRLGGRPDHPGRADRRAGVRGRHRTIGHLDPARAAGPRPRQPDPGDLGAAASR